MKKYQVFFIILKQRVANNAISNVKCYIGNGITPKFRKKVPLQAPNNLSIDSSYFSCYFNFFLTFGEIPKRMNLLPQISAIFLQLGRQDEDNFLASMLIFGAIVAFCAIVLTIAIIVIVFAILAVLIGGGLVSTSVLIGYKERSTKKGFRFFVISCCILLSNVVSVLLFWFLNLVYEHFETEIAVVLGIIVGSFIGYLLGILMFSASYKVLNYLILKFKTIFN